MHVCDFDERLWVLIENMWEIAPILPRLTTTTVVKEPYTIEFEWTTPEREKLATGRSSLRLKLY